MKKPSINLSEIFANLLALCALLAIGLGLVLTYYFIEELNNTSGNLWTDYNLMGMAGEFLGGTVGSIWALAGVILFFLALIYQKRELELQRLELHESRKIMEKQSKTIATQQFENTFFQLLNFHINAADNIRLSSTKVANKNLNPFDAFFVDFKKEINALKKRRKSDAGVTMPSDESYQNCFKAVYEGYKNTFQHYLENYKTLLFFIEDKSFDPSFYYNILKSHFTEQEVLLHFYYALLIVKSDRLGAILEKYHLLQKLNQRAVTEIDPFHLEQVGASAYQKEFE